jgi:AraC-like DNA-binding protein
MAWLTQSYAHGLVANAHSSQSADHKVPVDPILIADQVARGFVPAFRQSTGSSPHAYVMDRRLHKARDLVINRPELPIEQIRLRLGFSSSSHFSSAFRGETGLTPTEFRKTCSQ